MQLRWYQSEAVERTWRFLCEQRQNALIVAPTGAGKSVVIAALVAKVLEHDGRALVLAHRKELLSQNAEKMKAFGVAAGINSAGLRMRDIDADVICCGIQSVYSKAGHFGRRHVVLIDEAHLVPRADDGMYRQFLGELSAINPGLLTVGLTATPYRMDSGKLYGPTEPFNAVSYEIPLGRLIAEGYLSRLTCRPAVSEFDTSAIAVRGGEFVESSMQAAFDRAELTLPACREIMAATPDRRSVLIFCAGVEHAEHVQEMLGQLTGEPVGLVTGESPAIERAATLRNFRESKLRWLVNVDVLTTGFDAPQIDAICALRATQSPGLWAQMCGRGLRTAPGKTDCLVLDFGGNVKRHGPLDDPGYGVQRVSAGGSAGESSGPQKTCPGCANAAPAGQRVCANCGFRWPVQKPHDEAADRGAAILLEDAKPVRRLVEEVRFTKHLKKQATNPTPTLRVDYLCRSPEGGMLETVSEWVCLEHDGFARQKAAKWWRRRSKAPVPHTVDEAIELDKAGYVAWPEEITTIQEGRWQRVIGAEIPEPPEYEPESLLPTEISEFEAREANARRIIAEIRASGADVYLVADELCRTDGIPSHLLDELIQHHADVVRAIQNDLADIPF